MSSVEEIQEVEVDEQAIDQTDDDWRTDLINRIRAAEIAVQRAEAEWESSKEETKEAKAHFDNQVSKLRKLIRESREDLPLFDGANVSPTVDHPSDGPAEEGDDSKWPEDAMPKDDDSWREVGLEDLSLTESLLTKLYSGGLDTIGELADFTASGKQLVEIDGVGPAAAEKIEGAMDRFWVEWRDKTERNQ